MTRETDQKPTNGSDNGAVQPLHIDVLLDGARLLVVGGTGFVGKVWLAMLLSEFPNVDHIYMVVRERKNKDGTVRQSSKARFWEEVAPSPVFDPLRKRYPGAAFDAFIEKKLTPIPGDVTGEFGGVPTDIRDELRGNVSALVNAAGVVDFNPPLDESLNVNAFGMQNLVALCKDLSVPGHDVAFMHTSTCYVAGDRTGQVDEQHPFDFPFPRADSLDVSHWDPEREIAECVDMVEHVRHRANDAFRQSDFLDTAKKNLRAKNEPARGSSLEDELAKVKRRFEEAHLVDGGTERAKYWGWHNIYTYTKSIGEQILAASGLKFTIVRPAVVESALRYPRPAWNEGINTSAPLVYMALQGPVQYASAERTVLDVIPVDQVAIGMILSLAELLEGTAPAVYQYGTSDTNPLPILRLIELVGLFKRRHFRDRARGNAFVNWLQIQLEPIAVSVDTYYDKGPLYRSERLGTAAKWLKKFGQGALEPVIRPVTDTLETASKQMEVQAKISDQFVPFMATHTYRFSCANTRAAFVRLSAADQERLPWQPDQIDWREYLLDVHCPGLEKNVFPLIKDKVKKPKKALRSHDNLVAMLDEVAEWHDLTPALLATSEDGGVGGLSFTKITYRDLRGRATAAAVRLASAGVKPGDRVLISGDNSPFWPIAYFGILSAGAVAVPMDPGLTPEQVANILASSGASAAILDNRATEAFGGVLEDGSVARFEMRLLSEMGAVGTIPKVDIKPDDLASILYTSGTTGKPKGVMLTHKNFTAMLGSLSGVFPIDHSDRVLSVLPLHHAFEFSCGLLLPLSMGARIVYLDELTGDKLTSALQEGRITAMVGVPALWQLLERRIRSQVDDRGQFFRIAFDTMLEANRVAGRKLGMDLGPLFFGSVHSRFGGHIRMLVSGGAALPKETQKLFSGLGLHLAEGYGLTEAAPVLSVAPARPGSKGGTVGKAIPGVEIKVINTDDKGIGEVLARGDNVMAGYYGDKAATDAVIDEDGWLHTGDMGRLDHGSRLVLSGRAKEVVVTSAGENIYLDDVEQTLGEIDGVKEYALVGLLDPRGGERLGMLAVPDGEGEAARDAIKDAIAELPAFQRPSVFHLVEADLPRTATRKVQRKEVKKVLERIHAASSVRRTVRGGNEGPVVGAVVAVAGIARDKVNANTNLVESLAFDSLMWVELAAALDGMGLGHFEVVDLARCETIAELVEFVGQNPAQLPDQEMADAPEQVQIPAFIAGPVRRALLSGQRQLNGVVLDTRVEGEAHIPQNRQTIVVCNHTSHLDMGLVKFALGGYGEQMAALAAQDYFFEGNKWKVAYFTYLTHLEPIDRRSGFRTSLQQAKDVLDRGHVVLIFPEGTRRTDGTLGEFKPLVGKLCLDTQVDILPLHIDGAFRSLPKGAAFPKARGINIRIGPPLCMSDLLRLSEGQKASDAARTVANLAQRAVESLRDGDFFDISALGQLEEASSTSRGIEGVMKDLEGKFDPSRVEKPISWYFALGGKEGPRWTVSVDEEQCRMQPGRPQNGSADCVVKTSTELFSKLVCESYVPSPAEFMSGAIKTNEIPLLIEFSRVFNLTDVQA